MLFRMDLFMAAHGWEWPKRPLNSLHETHNDESWHSINFVKKIQKIDKSCDFC